MAAVEKAPGFGPLYALHVAARFRSGWQPTACRWCGGRLDRRGGPGFVCPTCDRGSR